jgi:hypothetical protein
LGGFRSFVHGICDWRLCRDDDPLVFMSYQPELHAEVVTPDGISLMTKSNTHAALDRADFHIPDCPQVVSPPLFWFSRIKAKREHRGDGTFLMKRICRYMDLMEATILNCPNPYGDRSYDELVSWFSQFGFTPADNDGAFVRILVQGLNFRLDVLYARVEELLQAGEFDLLDDFLRWNTTGDLKADTDMKLGWLTATLPAKSKLPSRPAFYDRCAEEIPEDILRGLE